MYAPTYPQMYNIHNLHALTIVIITNFIYSFCGGPLVVEAPGQLPSLPPPLSPALHRAKAKIKLAPFYGSPCIRRCQARRMLEMWAFAIDDPVAWCVCHCLHRAKTAARIKVQFRAEVLKVQGGPRHIVLGERYKGNCHTLDISPLSEGTFKEPRCRGAQLRHALSRDFTVLPAHLSVFPRMQ